MTINKQNLVDYVTTISFIFFVVLYGVYIGQIYDWLSLTLNQLVEWILNPIIHYKPVEVYNPILGSISFFLIILTGIFTTFLLLPKESHNDEILFFVTSIAMGLGLVGTITIFLIVFNVLSRLSLILVLSSIILILGILAYSHGIRTSRKNTMYLNFDWSLIKNIKQHTTEFSIILILSIFVFFSYYHALMYPILEWDALIYHAEVARLIYENMGLPLIAGSSINIEISSNYPPLFPAIGAFFYILINNFDDFYLRLIPPMAGLLIMLSTYKLGSLIRGRKYGLFSALVLVMFPLFVGYSVYATYYSLLTLFITLSILFIIKASATGNKQYMILSSVFLGFSLLTSYLTFYYLAFFILFLIGMIHIKKIELKYVLYILIIISVVGIIWYLRNLLLLGDPVYPLGYRIFNGKNIDSELLYYTFIHLKRDSGFIHCDDYLCRLSSSLVYIISDWRLCSPLILLFIFGSFLVMIQKRYYNLIIVLWSLFFIMSLPVSDWFWMRYFMLILPSISVIIPGALFKLVSMPTLVRIKPKFKMFILISILLFPSIIFSVVGANQFYCFSDKDNCIYNLIHPGFKEEVLKRAYKKDYECWIWINENLHKDEMVATFDPRLYYLKYDENVFPLDGWDARGLYDIKNLEQIIAYLKQRKVRYIMISNWLENGSRANPGYSVLPLTKHLNSAYFPLIFNSTDGYCTIYGVSEIRYLEEQDRIE